MVNKSCTIITLFRYEVTLCKECITWATEEKRIFLRQALEARLIGLYYDTGNYQVTKNRAIDNMDFTDA